MNLLKNPEWVNQFSVSYASFRDIPDQSIKEMNERLASLCPNEAEVSIVIAAKNEEQNIFNCINSISFNKTKFATEVIIVNNMSEDGTADLAKKMNVKLLHEEKRGTGPCRELGQRNAVGKYILLADADCIYPEQWIEILIQKLKLEEVVAVYGRYSFLGDNSISRWKLALYEFLKNILAEIRNFKRPFINAYGMSMGYVKDLGLKIGYDLRGIRGSDGRLVFDLMQYGKVKYIRSNDAKPWTGYRTLLRDGSIKAAVKKRIKNEWKNFKGYFKSLEMHDTKTSLNE